ncbi:MAG: hypothetical protein LBE44_03700 [Microbacterium hominis]|nr:hypothetical protein [Microbacterium hominis]
MQVNALFDYAATSAEEFSFSTGDVIAVTGTDVRPALRLHSQCSRADLNSLQPDGWWQGNRVGDSGSSKLFPSKCVLSSLFVFLAYLLTGFCTRFPSRLNSALPR